jgi:hypothetical protein
MIAWALKPDLSLWPLSALCIRELATGDAGCETPVDFHWEASRPDV